MPIPNFSVDGLLPEGTHEVSMDEVKSRFGSFQSTDRRPHLFVKLAEFVAALRRVPISGFLIIDGSFVTQEPQPNDIDLILVLPSGWQREAELSPAEYNVLSSKSAKRLWGIDLLVACDGTKEYAEYVALFQRVRYRRDVRKGVLRIRL